MGSKLKQLRSQLEDAERKGAEIIKIVEQKIREAQEIREPYAPHAIIDLDDDDKAALESVRTDIISPGETICSLREDEPCELPPISIDLREVENEKGFRHFADEGNPLDDEMVDEIAKRMAAELEELERLWN